MKRCSCCKLDKNTDNDFGVDRRRPDGLNVYCKECIRSKSAEQRELHLSRNKEYTTEWNKRHPERKMLERAKRRAKDQDVPFTISEEDIDIPNICPVCSRKLLRAVGQQSGWSSSPTLDKWEPELGYVSDNVWVICMDCNNKKGNLSGNDLLSFTWKLIDAWKEENSG